MGAACQEECGFLCVVEPGCVAASFSTEKTCFLSESKEHIAPIDNNEIALFLNF